MLCLHRAQQKASIFTYHIQCHHHTTFILDVPKVLQLGRRCHHLKCHLFASHRNTVLILDVSTESPSHPLLVKWEESTKEEVLVRKE